MFYYRWAALEMDEYDWMSLVFLVDLRRSDVAKDVHLVFHTTGPVHNPPVGSPERKTRLETRSQSPVTTTPSTDFDRVRSLPDGPEYGDETLPL